MSEAIKNIMTSHPRTLPETATIAEAAKVMRDEAVGALIVTTRTGGLCGIVTDRDLVVRGMAQLPDPLNRSLGEVCSRNPQALSPNDTVDDAVKAMAGANVRRLPVLEGQAVVGIVSLGDLARAKDPESALGSISAAPAQA